MYGYCTPRKPELTRLRVVSCESEVNAFLRSFAGMSRDDVIEAMLRAGPLREPIERELARVSRDKRR